jgi:hypothetical protein
MDLQNRQMYWGNGAGFDGPSRTAGVFNISGAPRGAGGLASVVTSLPGSSSGSFGRRLLQLDGSSLTDVIAATNAAITGIDPSTLSSDQIDDTATTTCGDDAITECSAACLPADM